jgi:thioredoxin 1
MATIELTEDNFEETVRTVPDVRPRLQKRPATRHADIVFGEVDTEAQPELVAGFRISSIPTLTAVRDRTVLYTEPG